MFLLRPVQHTDHKSLLELARFLGSSGSLPLEENALADFIALSCKSFSSPSEKKEENMYVFVLEDQLQKKIVGSSLIFAKHGTSEAPHTYLRVFEKTHEDDSTQIKKTHQMLRFEFDTDGPSEIGGLILHPDFRKLPLGLGRQLSFGRFLFMGMYPERFETHVIAELLPPFDKNGTSPLWEAFGKRFTDLSYQEADRLSRTNKDFIKNLFPPEDIYTDLFSEHAQAVIGQAGPDTLAAQKLLEKIGFRYLHAVDPFDGGPHYGAKVSEITLVKRMHAVQIEPQNLTEMGKRGFLCFEGKNGFGCLSLFFKETDTSLQISADAKQILTTQEAKMEKLFAVSGI